MPSCPVEVLDLLGEGDDTVTIPDKASKTSCFDLDPLRVLAAKRSRKEEK